MRSLQHPHHLGIGPEIDVALAIAQLDVAQAFPLRRAAAAALWRPSASFVAQTVISPLLVCRARLRRRSDRRGRADRGLPRRSRRAASCRARPGDRRSRRASVRKLSLPMSRLSMIRPATLTTGPPSWPISGLNESRISFSGRRFSTAPPNGSMPSSRSFCNFARRSCS